MKTKNNQTSPDSPSRSHSECDDLFAKIFRERLQTARTTRKMTQHDVARKTGLMPSAISHFETGGRRPSIENLKKLCESLDVRADYLLGLSKRAPVPQKITIGENEFLLVPANVESNGEDR